MKELIDKLVTFTRHAHGCLYESPVITAVQEPNGHERRTETWSNQCTCTLNDTVTALRAAANAAVATAAVTNTADKKPVIAKKVEMPSDH